MSSITIALDIMGGDDGPHVMLKAARKSLLKHPDLNLQIFALKESVAHDSQILVDEFPDRLQFFFCNQVVETTDKPTDALRKKKESSMRIALEHVVNGSCDACVSSGNTGALMAMAYSSLRCISGVHRPALVSSLPTYNKNKVHLLDLGASINCDAEALFQYGLMGSVLAETCYSLKKPRVALLNVGEEDIKGSSLIKHANELLKQCKEVNYIGYVEGNQLFTGDADVIVTDGFTGNVALKSSEGIAKFVLEEAKKHISASKMSKLLSFLLMPYLKNLYKKMNPDQYNGASLIGLRGIVIKSHGNATEEACFYAIEQAIKEVKHRVPEKIKTKIENVLLEH